MTHISEWHRADSDRSVLLYTLKQDGWRKGQPAMVNDITVRIENAHGSGHDLAPIADAILAALASRHPQPVNEPGEWDDEISEWVLVPRETTEEMCQAAFDSTWFGELPADVDCSSIEDIWMALLNAAPAPPPALRAVSIPKVEPGVKGSPVTLAECPIGLFYAGGEPCLKTEYGDNNGRIDAYIVSSGEFFWGGTSTPQEQRKVLVQPFELSPSTSEGEAVFISRAFDPMTAGGFEAAAAPQPTPVAPVPVTITDGWFSPEVPPVTPKGTDRYFIVAVRRAHNGKVWTFPAQYLNAYPLEFEVCECEAEHDDGCPTTGWYTASSDGEYDENYSPLLSPGDELVAWSEIQRHPLDARLDALSAKPTGEE